MTSNNFNFHGFDYPGAPPKSHYPFSFSVPPPYFNSGTYGFVGNHSVQNGPPQDQPLKDKALNNVANGLHTFLQSSPELSAQSNNDLIDDMNVIKDLIKQEVDENISEQEVLKILLSLHKEVHALLHDDLSIEEFLKKVSVIRREMVMTKPIFVNSFKKSPGNEARGGSSNTQNVMFDKDEDCIFCYELLSSNAIITLECKHQFHDVCLRRWAENEKYECPFCKAHIKFPEDFPVLKK